MSELLKSVQTVSDDLTACIRNFEQAEKDANAREHEARHIRNVVMPELKAKRAELQAALVHKQTIGKVNDAVASAEEYLAKAVEARRNQEAEAERTKQLREEVEQQLKELREERKKRDEAQNAE